jgi:carbohydrate-selective porin OprB
MYTPNIYPWAIAAFAGRWGTALWPEQIAEPYYSIAVIDRLTISPDLQFIRNPGYNRDRRPARFAG